MEFVGSGGSKSAFLGFAWADGQAGPCSAGTHATGRGPHLSPDCRAGLT
jgi:hypothetical protein